MPNHLSRHGHRTTERAVYRAVRVRWGERENGGSNVVKGTSARKKRRTNKEASDSGRAREGPNRRRSSLKKSIRLMVFQFQILAFYKFDYRRPISEN